MNAPDDDHVSGYGVPASAADQERGELDRDDDLDGGAQVGAHARRVEVPEIEVPRHPLPDRRRYFLSCVEPSGDYDSVIIAVTDGDRRRYFSTRDGERLTEVDEHSFDQRRESGARSMLELDERELGELEVELQFVRPVRGRDPIAEAAAGDAEAVAAEVAAEPEAAEAEPSPEVARAAEPEVDDEVWHEDEADEPEAEVEVDPVTEEFETMMASTVTFERDDAAEPVENEVRDAAPPVPAAPAASAASATAAAPEAPVAPPSHALSADDAIAQVALAKGIAFIAHRGQHDRSGAPYIDHPGRIAERFDPVSEPVEAAAAWLHDVLEDSPVTPQELFEAGVMPDVIEVVQLLTRTREVTVDEYYARIRRDPVARRVKLADIDDNTARWRLRRLDYDTQLRLVEKYRVARLALGAG